MPCPCTMQQTIPAPPVVIPLNPVVGAVAGLALGAMLKGTPTRYLLGGVGLGVVAWFYNTWAFARYTEQVVAAGAVVR